jgi:hypothetical protein
LVVGHSIYISVREGEELKVIIAEVESMEEPASVQVIESCLVAPREATPTKGLWLSPLDVALANTGRTCLVFLYPSGATFLDVARLKEAMAKALVAYYPLAGRLGVDDDGRAEISCNGEGALFVVARSRCLTAQDVDCSKPSPELNSMFVPSIEPAAPLILATQVHTYVNTCIYIYALDWNSLSLYISKIIE